MAHNGKWFSILVCRAGWLVQLDGLTLSHGHATRESAEAWVKARP